jgi:hypothetical protein
MTHTSGEIKRKMETLAARSRVPKTSRRRVESPLTWYISQDDSFPALPATLESAESEAIMKALA